MAVELFPIIIRDVSERRKSVVKQLISILKIIFTIRFNPIDINLRKMEDHIIIIEDKA